MARRYFVERLSQSAVTLVSVVTLSFALIRFMPGGAIDYLIAQYANDPTKSAAEVRALIEGYVNINPDAPIWQQYLNYLGSLAQGDLGQSIWYNEPVIDILAEALPWTLFHASIGLTFSFLMGVVFGAFMAYYEGSRFDEVLTITTLLTTSTPYYIVALLLLFAFAFQTNIFPTGGRLATGVEPGINYEFVKSALYHAALPILSGLIAGFGGGALNMRGNSIRILGEDYLRVARLRGLPERRIILRYVARNAMLPMWTGLMIRIGAMVGGAVILEQIFAYPGVGYYMFKALQTRDSPLLMGGFLLITFSVVVGILVADLTYGLIDPRAQHGGERESY